MYEKVHRTLLIVPKTRGDKNEAYKEFETRRRKEAFEIYQQAQAILKSHPPCVTIVNRNKMTIQCPRSKSVTLNSENPNHQWLFKEIYQSPNIRCPYVLVKLDTLAHATKLSSD